MQCSCRVYHRNGLVNISFINRSQVAKQADIDLTWRCRTSCADKSETAAARSTWPKQKYEK